MSEAVFVIYISVGLSALLVPIDKGNAKVLIAWNEWQTWLHALLFVL